MKLLVDVGNSRLKWAWLDRGELRDPGGVSHRGEVPRRTIAELSAAGRRPSQVLVASVVAPALTAAIADGLAQELGAPARIAETEAAAAGVWNGYLDPRQLGVDRWLAMLAAFARYRTAVCIVDAGTALTVDAVAPDGRHLGGLIVPGPGLMRGALLQQTGGISSAADLLGNTQAGRDLAGDFWGRDIEACIRLGSRRAIACLVETCMKALARPDQPAGVLVLTGGDAPALLGALSIPAEHRPLLVLEGLALRHDAPSG